MGEEEPHVTFDLRSVSITAVAQLCAKFHGYGGASSTKTYAFGVFEDEKMIAAYAWQPPPPGAAANICPEAPHAVLALSRMVAVPKEARRLRHVSKPLRQQMRRLIDRTRWPVLVTYSDRGQGHTGHVYKCSGWERTRLERVSFFVDEAGKRSSRYANGKTGGRELTFGGHTEIDRWEHWACPRGGAAKWLERHGWTREPIPGKVWRSGRQAHRIVRREESLTPRSV